MDGKSLTHGGSVVDRRLEQRKPVSFPTLKSHEQHRRVGRETGPGRLDDRLRLGGRLSRFRELA